MSSTRPRYPSRPLPSQAAPASRPPPQLPPNLPSSAAPEQYPTAHIQPSSSPLPPDVASVCKDRISKAMLSLFQHPPPQPRSAAGDPPPFVKGIGLYTHGEVEPRALAPLFPHQRFVQPPPKIDFVPLGGTRRTERKTAFKAEIPADVQALYEKVREAILAEEGETRKPSYPDPRERFEALGLPSIMVPSTPPIEEEDWEASGAMHIDGVGGGRVAREDDRSSRRAAVQKERQQQNGGGRRLSGAGDVAMGGVARSGAGAAARKTAPSSAIGATTYDPSRDPRRRGR